MKIDKGVFTISLDFELHWGIFDVIDIDRKKECFANTRNVIPQILNLFERYNVQCTWAIVGMLYNENLKELEANLPKNQPSYTDRNLSAYDFLKNKYDDSHSDSYFAPNLVKLIRDTPGQAVSSHTYSHFYTMEQGQTKFDFEDDIKACVKAASKFNIELKSIIPPRNQYNKEYDSICYKYGIDIIRKNPPVWYNKREFKPYILNRIFRTADCYLKLSNTTYDLNSIERSPDQPLILPSSRFYKPVSSRSILDKMRLRRIKNEMLIAARKGRGYHLWWHPHNFGDNPKQSLVDLEIVLKYYQKLKAKYEFQSMSMETIKETYFN